MDRSLAMLLLLGVIVVRSIFITCTYRTHVIFSRSVFSSFFKSCNSNLSFSSIRSWDWYSLHFLPWLLYSGHSWLFCFISYLYSFSTNDITYTMHKNQKIDSGRYSPYASLLYYSLPKTRHLHLESGRHH